MNRLQSELRRLYLPAEPAQASLIDARGRCRALVFELASPADWIAIGRVWRGVQADLGLPAPAIAVNGRDGFQLWFSLADALPPEQAWAFLDALRRRYLPDIAAQRIALLPSAAPGQPPLPSPLPAPLPPAPQDADEGRWSAFVAPDLAPVFADTPWLDLMPGEDGQADLLCRLASIRRAELDAAAALLPAPPAQESIATPTVAGATVSGAASSAHPPQEAMPAYEEDPRRFLLRVMNDGGVALALRIEAAKALLPPAFGQGGNELSA